MDTKIWGIIGGVALVLALLSPLVLGNTKKVERLFDDAEGCYERSEYADALEKYNKSLKESKKYGVKTEIIDTDFAARVNYRIGRCLKQLDRDNEALEYYRFIIVEFPESQYTTHSYVDSGDIYYDRGDYKAASEEYKRALETTDDEEWKNQIYQKYQQTLVRITPIPPPIPQPPLPATAEIDIPNFAALTKATFLRFEKHFEEAAAHYKAFANHYLPFEDGIYALYWAGRCYYNAALFPQSVGAFKRLVDEYDYMPNAIEAYHGLAEAYYTWAKRDGDISKYQLAIRTVERAERLYARSDDTKVGNWLERMHGIKQTAVEKLDNIREPDPPPPTPDELVQQGLEHYRRGALDAARQKAAQALNLDPDYSPADELLSKIKVKYYVRQGLEHYRRGALDAARQKALQALNLDPNYSPADELLSKIKVKYYERGLESLDANRYNEAINTFDKVINIDAQYKEAHFHLGVAYFNLRNYAYAKNAVNDALAIDPEYEEARRLLAEIIGGHD